MRQHIKFRWLSIFVASVLLSGCDFNNLLDTDIEAIVSSPTLAIPIGYGDLSISDFLNDSDSSNIKIYQSGADKDVLYLAYEQTLKTQGIRDLLEIPDKSVTRGYNINPTAVAVSVPANTTRTTGPGTLTFDLAFDPEKFDEILFTEGTLNLSAQTNPILPNLQFEAEVTLGSFQLNNVPLTRTITAGAAAQTVSVAGYKALLDNNKFDATVTVTIKSGASPALIPAGTLFNVSLSFNNLNFDYVIGFFGEQSADLPEETLKIGAFESLFEDVDVSIASPRISFIVINEYGIPVDVTFDALEARNSSGALSVVTNPSSPISANVPAIRGDSAFTTVIVTNAKELLDFAPTEFFYKVSAVINQGLTDGNNFCENDAELSVRMNVEIPFIGHASNIMIADTLDLDLGDIENSEIESAAIKINAINMLPLDASVQLYLLDENLLVIDSLLDTINGANAIIVGAETDLTGTPTNPGVYDDEIEISNEKMNKLLEAKKIIIAATLQTADNPKDVKFLATDKLTIKLGLKAKVKLNVDL